jgi:hypothetical protein
MIDSDGPAEETPRRYRNPPIEHRFRKGFSGNPRGRPRKIPALVATKIGGQPGIGFEDRIKSLAIEEAYRIITIREGDRVEKIPVIQAILRKVANQAKNDAYNQMGPSPRVRGSLRTDLDSIDFRGSIPARAGEPSSAPRRKHHLRVHPRACGGAFFRAAP